MSPVSEHRIFWAVAQLNYFHVSVMIRYVGAAIADIEQTYYIELLCDHETTHCVHDTNDASHSIVRSI